DALLLSSEAGERLRGLAAEIDAVGPSSVAAGLDREITRRAQFYLAGLEAYRRHPYRRSGKAPPVLWREGTTRLLDYAGDTAGPAVLATPWDFHAERAHPARFFGLLADCLPLLCDNQGALPVEVIQSLFFMLDPFSAERKFTRFAALDPNGDTARAFVALEDWVNDGVPLAAAVARDCARSWYGDNEPARGLWQIGGETVDPKHLRWPALVVVPDRDR